MNKENTLKMSQKNRTEQELINAEDKGRRVGFVLFALIAFIVMVVDLFYGYGNCISAMISVLFAFQASEAYGKFTITKNKSNIFIMICTGLASIFALLNFIQQTLKI